MLYLVRSYELIKDREKTYLTSAIAAAATTLTVKAVDANAWADNDWIIVGEIGSKNTEILQVNGAVSDGTSLVVDNAGTGGARFAHSVNEPVYRIDYNQVELSRATTETGTKTVLATNELQVDEEYTRYEDTVNSTGYGFVRFKNSLSGAFSSYSDGIPYTGYTPRSLGRMIKMVRRRLGENQVGVTNLDFIDDDDIREELNEKQRDIAHERLWSFYEDMFSDSRVAYQRAYTINANAVLGKNHTVTVESEPLAKIDTPRFNILHWDTARTGEPTHYRVWNNQIELYPLPDATATATTLDGALTAAATSITVVSTSGFSPSGRIIIEDEVISYSNISSTAFRGCVRGVEETTAATHVTTTAVTERDIIYTVNREPEELLDTGDETQIPDPDILVNGASMELALGKLNDQVLHDRLKIKYDEGVKKLRNKFGKKGTASSYRIKDRFEVITDVGRMINPQDYPEDIG